MDTTLYSYRLCGTASDGQTWRVLGTIELTPGDFASAFAKAMRDGFAQLTLGKAVYGKPGVGCRGPYKITHLSLDAQSPVDQLLNLLDAVADSVDRMTDAEVAEELAELEPMGPSVREIIERALIRRKAN
jgi:hypothetical protein